MFHVKRGELKLATPDQGWSRNKVAYSIGLSVPAASSEAVNAFAQVCSGEREGGTARLEEAVAAYREALKERTRARVPLQWAQTQENLVLVYRALFARTGKRVHLDDALRAADGALEEFRKAKADFYIDKAERQRAEILAMKDKPKNRVAKNKP